MYRYACLVLMVLAACGREGNEVTSDVLVGSKEGIEYTPRGTNGSAALAPGTELTVDANVNLREAPAADARVLMVIPADATATIVERTDPENGYYQVDYLGRTGWAYGAYLSAYAPVLGSSSSALTDAQRDNILDRANLSVGFSYWWGHGRFGCGLAHGNCSGSGCPDSCSHSGSAGADCSGMVAKAWGVPASAAGPCTDGHPYSSTYFATNSDHWSNIARADIQRGDAFVLIGGGHIMIRGVGQNSSGEHHIIECAGCTSGCINHYRTVSSSYKAIRRDENL